MNQVSEKGSAAAESKNDKRFSLERIYVKEKSFKGRNMPGIFREAWKPEISLEVQIKEEKLESPSNAQGADAGEHYEVVLSIRIDAKQNNITVATMEVQQAGIFLLNGFSAEEKKAIFSGYCPDILFPYARKIISDMTVDASLPPLLLAPINFLNVYSEQLRKQGAPASDKVN